MDDEYDNGLIPDVKEPDPIVPDSAQEPGTEDDPPSCELPEVDIGGVCKVPEPTTKECSDGRIVPIDETCENIGEVVHDEKDPCDLEWKPPSSFIVPCCDGKECPEGHVELTCGVGMVQEGDICIHDTLPSCDPGWIRSADQVNCEMGPDLIAEEEARRILEEAEEEANVVPPSGVPALQTFAECMAQTATILNPDDIMAEAEGRPQYLLFPDGDFNTCRFPDGNFQADWMDTGRKATEADVAAALAEGRTIELGSPILQEMWHTAAWGLQTPEWYKEQGINRPTNSATRSQGSTTDGTYTWDSRGNILAGPCCEGDVCGTDHGSFRICPTDPNKEARGFVGEGGNPNHFNDTRNRILSSLQTHLYTSDDRSGLLPGGYGGYRQPWGMMEHDRILGENLAQWNILQDKKSAAQKAYDDAKAKADAARQAALTAQSDAEAYRLRKEAEAAEAEAERIRKEEEEKQAAIVKDAVQTTSGGILGTAGGGTTIITDPSPIASYAQRDTGKKSQDIGIPSIFTQYTGLSEGTGFENFSSPVSKDIDLTNFLYGATPTQVNKSNNPFSIF